ncbi:MAG: hypothetical protein R2844_04310 [Caldilineales bacterium]
MIDPNNPIVQLCAQGMQAEFDGKPDVARALFTQAWEDAQDDFEASIAAHFLARQQDTPADTLHWNQVSLARADAVADERVESFYPSLYLNLGHSYEVLGDLEQASKYYDLAAAKTSVLDDDRYGGIVRQGIAAGKSRITAASDN